MTEAQWDGIQGQIEGLARCIAHLAGELNGTAAHAVGDYAQQLLSEADRLDGPDAAPQLQKAAHVMRLVGRLSMAVAH